MDYKLPKRLEYSNKGTFGRVLNISGSDYMPGAAYLSSVSALKIGCGYCFLCSTEKVISSVAAQTQNVVFIPIDGLCDNIKNFPPNVVEIGCGLSQDKFAEERFYTAIENISQKTPVLIDADGLNIISKNPERYIKQGLEKVIMTPHPKEASRLLGCSLSDILAYTSMMACEISKKYNCVTVLKTHKTVVVSPDNRFYENDTGNNSMAKAGSGDVLAGMISGLVAQGMDLFEGASLGVYLHGLSGDIAAEKLTEYSVMAEDLISYIPSAIKMYLLKN